MKRYLLCLTGGMMAAALCVTMMIVGGKGDAPPSMMLAIAGNRILIGFVLGISGWRVHWAWHGVMVGLIVSLATAVAILPDWAGFTAFTITGMLYGFFIELIAVKIFRQPVP